MIDLIVVGSGAAGTWAARQASREGLRTVVLDVGRRPPSSPLLAGHFFDLRRNDPRAADFLIGAEFESLASVVGGYTSPKLRSPRFSFVTNGARDFGPVVGAGFEAVQSFARGGLANAWGAGAYRYTAEDLRPFPLPVGALDPFYDELTREIGISGVADDLASHFGSTESLQPPLELDRMGKRLLQGYERRRSAFQAQGFTIGRPRLAALSRPLPGREACPYDNLSFWEPRLSYLYTPGLTLDGLVAAGKVEYAGERLVLGFEEKEAHVEVRLRPAGGGAEEVLSCRRLILAAGALNSARLVLASHADRQTRLPLLDNQPSMVPFVHPLLVGEACDRTSHGLGQLNVVYRGRASRGYVQGTYYSYTSLLGSEVVLDFPLTARGGVAACRYLLPAFSLVTFFYADEGSPSNGVRLGAEGELIFSYTPTTRPGEVERHFIAQMRGLGFLSHPVLMKVPGPGQGIHYAGTLPMGRSDVRYGTEPSGRLRGTRAVYVADAAVFPSLPAKNHTLTIMANAMRVATQVTASLRQP